jgi:N-acyl-D-amino-acid deacylase
VAAVDLLIRGARLIDGSGAPWVRGDLAVSAGRIAAIGPSLDLAATDTVLAEDRYLAPGFIDAHCHDDLIGLREPARPEKTAQGVTTVVVGNCGFSLFPHDGASAAPLRRHFGSLLGDVAADEVFADFAGYRARLEGQGMAPNLVALAGHAALRLAVVGADERPATAVERRAMQALLDAQLRQGAAGLSLGLAYPPSAYADEDELLALAETVAAHGAILAAHVRSYEGGLLTAVDEFLALLARARAAGLLSHLQAAGRPYWGGVRHAIARLEAARRDGVDVAFDMYPYPAGSSTILQLLPPSAQAGGVDRLLARLDQPAERERLRRAVVDGLAADAGWESKVRLIGWSNVQIAGVADPALKPLEGQRLDAAAAGGDPFDFLLRLVAADRGRTSIVMFQLDDGDLRAALTHPLHMLGSDGLPRPGSRPHPRAFGSFPRYIGHCSGDLGWLGLEAAVRHMTAAPAARFGLADRGSLRLGGAADLVLFSPGARDGATFEQPTLPPVGIDRVWVAGAAVIVAGRATGARPGRVLSPSPQPQE